MHTYIHTHMCTNTQTYIHTHKHTHTHTNTHTHTHTHNLVHHKQIDILEPTLDCCPLEVLVVALVFKPVGVVALLLLPVDDVLLVTVGLVTSLAEGDLVVSCEVI